VDQQAMAEYRYRAVRELLNGSPVGEVRCGIAHRGNRSLRGVAGSSKNVCPGWWTGLAVRPRARTGWRPASEVECAASGGSRGRGNCRPPADAQNGRHNRPFCVVKLDGSRRVKLG